MNTNEKEQIRVYSRALLVRFHSANDSLVSETAEMGFVGGTVAAATPLARRSAAKTAQRVGQTNAASNPVRVALVFHR